MPYNDGYEMQDLKCVRVQLIKYILLGRILTSGRSPVDIMGDGANDGIGGIELTSRSGDIGVRIIGESDTGLSAQG